MTAEVSRLRLRHAGSLSAAAFYCFRIPASLPCRVRALVLFARIASMQQIIQQLRRQWFALIAAGVALLCTIVTWQVSQRFPFALFIAAVMVSAWRGGLRPGLVTTVT